jgi:hypothetical protein
MLMEDKQAIAKAKSSDLFSVVLSDDWSINVNLSPIPLLILAAIFVVIFLLAKAYRKHELNDWQLDGAEMGLGDLKLSFKPNNTDRQIAYSIWVELSTRKIGLPIYVEDDVISEVYDSWYAFFGVTREMIKDIPVSKVRGNSTSQIIDLSVEVLNEGLRPHLTKWQARFRHWYERQMDNKSDASPQEVQKDFPAYDELIADLLEVNKRLMIYRLKMNELVRG